LGIGDWGLGPIPNPQSPIPRYIYSNNYNNSTNNTNAYIIKYTNIITNTNTYMLK